MRPLQLLQLLLLFAPAVPALADISVQLDPWCDNSIRIRLRPPAGSGCGPSSAASVPATMYTNSQRGDSVLCISEDCVHSETTSGYVRGAVQGFTPGAAVLPNETTHLSVYYDHKALDNLVGPAGNLPSYGKRTHGYKMMFADGSILKRASAVAAPTKPLVLYYSDQSHHFLTTTGKAPAGFKQLQILGYLCLTQGCGGLPPAPVPPPGPPLPVLSELPGALRRECLVGGASSPPPPLTTVPGSLRHGNLEATINAMGSGGQLSIRFTRVSDNRTLTVARPGFGAAAPASTNYQEMSLQLSGPADGSVSRVVGLGQIEGTPAHGGCDGNGTSSFALPLARNGLQMLPLSASKFHVGIPWVYSLEAGFGMLANMPGDGTVSVSTSGAMAWDWTTQQQLDFWITTTSDAAAAASPPSPPSAPSAVAEDTRGHGSPSLVSEHGAIYEQYSAAVGRAPPLPDYAALFWQCRLRYRTSGIAQDIAAGYHRRNISLGVLVVDFMNQQRDGDFHMNPQCYGSGQEITKWVANISRLGGGQTRTMLSFWPDVKPDADAAKILGEAGCISGSVVPGGHVQSGTIDPTSAKCRGLIWRQFVKPNYFDHGIRDYW